MMSRSVEYTPELKGAQWWKVDFHAHSPASFDFGGREGVRTDDKTTYEEWLLAYMQSEIDVVVITDHNSHEGILPAINTLDSMREQRIPGFRELCILPGVEITASGDYHLLVILEKGTNPEEVNQILAASEYKGVQGESNTATEKSVQNIIDIVLSRGGIVIPAHIDKEKGISRDHNTLQSLVEGKKITAVEVTADISDEVKQAGWIPVLGSDAHFLNSDTAPPGIEAKYPGSHYTFIKMGEPSLEGIKSAFASHDGSVLRSIDTDLDPNDYEHSVVEKIIVSKGDLEREYSFSPWLNSIIGGRGVGKSTVIELMRLALGQFDSLPKTLQSDLGWFSPVLSSREDKFWDEKTRIEVYYRKFKKLYRIIWIGTDPNNSSIELWNSGSQEWKSQEGNPTERFPMVIRSQKEIFESTKDNSSLMHILDGFNKNEVGNWSREKESFDLKYREKFSEVASVNTSTKSYPVLTGELNDIDSELQILTERVDSPESRELSSLQRTDKLVSKQKEEFNKIISDLDMYLSSGQVESFTEEIIGASQEEESYFKMARTLLSVLFDDFTKLRNHISSYQPEYRKTRDEKIRLLKNNLGYGEADALQNETSDLNKKEKLEAEMMKKKDQLKQIEGDKSRLNGLKEDLSKRLEKIIEHRKKLTTIREEISSKLEVENLKFEIYPMGDERGLEKSIRNIFNRDVSFDNFFSSENFTRLIGHPKAKNRRSEAIQSFKDNLKNLYEEGESAECYQAWKKDYSFNKNLLKALQEQEHSEIMTKIDLWFPEDYVEVKYKPEGVGSFQEIDKGSPGQKTAALLALVLEIGDEPLILDQPEDDIDNKLVYDLIVQELRKRKTRRQVIVATHNANIVVNADSDKVLVIEHGDLPAIEKQGVIHHADVKEKICQIMEGGEVAFSTRYRKLVNG